MAVLLCDSQTAEMPGMYQGGEYDLAGFATGTVKKVCCAATRLPFSCDRYVGILNLARTSIVS